jgi:zinc protease
MFFAVAGVRPGVSIDDVESAFFGEIDKIREEGVTVEEVAKAKRQLEVSLVKGLDTSHALADRIGRETVSFGRVRTLDERLEAIQAVTAEDVKRVVSKYLVPEKRNVVQLIMAPPEPVPAAAASDAAVEGGL